MTTLYIITRCTRTDNIEKVKSSIYDNENVNLFNIKWRIAFDTSSIMDIDSNLLSSLSNNIDVTFSFYKGIDGDFGHNIINQEIEKINDVDSWVYVLDDDNILHENFYKVIYYNISIKNPNIFGFVFNQFVNGKDFSGLSVRESSPDNMKVQHIDMAQFLMSRRLIGEYRLPIGDYKADGYWIERIYNENPDNFTFINEILSYYNFFDKKTYDSSPKILVLGKEDVNLKSYKYFDFESDNLNVISKIDDVELDKYLRKFDPDCILTIGEDHSKFTAMLNKSLDFRRRWIHSNEIIDEVGQMSYNCAMNYIIGSSYKEETVSIFTPIYNTGDKLRRTYESLSYQSYPNWEWVIVNDSTDGGKTLKIAEELANNDARIKIYDFREKSGGVIGESKYRAAVLCSGKYIVELDHDDYLTNDAINLMVQAYLKYPDAKFVYSDCAEIFENFSPIKYGPGFAFGYGSYYQQEYGGMTFEVAVSPNINPRTIRHIVGVPNHFRSWDREFYLSIGGHNRRLTIADDYELVIRTFLKTKMVKIPRMCYLQFYHNSNSQDRTRADIQRRVRTISSYYNEPIKNRFQELGKEDWAYNTDISKYGDDEGYVNYIFEP